MELFFSNTSSKIKTVAIVLLAVALFGALLGIGCLLIGIIVDVKWMTYTSLALILDLPIVWINTLLIYGFGILVEKAEPEKNETIKKEETKTEEKTYRCPKCKNAVKYGDETCNSCGVTIKW